MDAGFGHRWYFGTDSKDLFLTFGVRCADRTRSVLVSLEDPVDRWVSRSILEFPWLLYGFRTADDHGRAPPDVLECGGNLTPVPTETRGSCVTKVPLCGTKPAAALDSAMHPSQTRALRPGESAIAAVRMEPGA